jgi:hypothetical protein
MGGVTVNEVFYKEVYAFRENGLNFSAFAAPVIGLGYQISPKLGLELNVPFWLIFFQGAVYLGVNSVVGVEYALGAAAPGVAPPPRPAREKAPTAAGGKYWSLSTGAGVNIPIGPTAQALGLGIPALVELDYNLPLGGGTLALGAVTGFQYQATRKDVRYLYTLLTEPLGASVSYRLNSLLPFYLNFGAMGGVTVNEVFYKEVYAFRENGLNFSAFAAPVIGLGYQLSPKLGLELNVPFWLIFFQGAVYMGVSPALGVEIRL